MQTASSEMALTGLNLQLPRRMSGAALSLESLCWLYSSLVLASCFTQLQHIVVSIMLLFAHTIYGGFSNVRRKRIHNDTSAAADVSS